MIEFIERAIFWNPCGFIDVQNGVSFIMEMGRHFLSNIGRRSPSINGLSFCFENVGRFVLFKFPDVFFQTFAVQYGRIIIESRELDTEALNGLKYELNNQSPKP